MKETEINQGNTLTTSQQLSLIRPVTEEEIRQTFMSMLSDKSPGTDGYGAGFYKKAWPIIKDDCVAALQEFFRSRKLLREVNCTNIVLIPKSDCPNDVSDYRPIALCNYIYKCLTKILCNRLQEVLPMLIRS
ncbi:MAG: hypothetical protein Q8877_02995 [Sweet potato little leaf phytoplasma]|nr:hypothetical protein [Sweet potato little leaf phytoplasma]